ncbi:chemotaxis response regulator protein-glutamate methylesterase [Erythrobacter sp. SCSIO 43205]|uniref:protein-glutamate methylesterase/protein-glutamine glutaminase n=1 Tax=Erythrobacter sp. SCSIO 43205 TaxID=2779361 RepID=UPI001CA84DEF|nr:chemotaxis response regulator protein-glutamate methylesterase [Erythrobacter sp. SCSIO 43205]UAB77856.1 chemotaxis response regulator protein-glutamate methylesterase [Erythrobacter sp. SCSIO 43205]
MASGKIRVLVVDDSASVRQAMKEVLEQDSEIEVIATAADPFAAARYIQQEVPDVITLDVEMPRMDGITFLRKLMQQCPVPVVMCSSLTEEGTETLMQALEAGAVDVILKPPMGVADHLIEAREMIRQTVKAAAKARVSELKAKSPSSEVEKKLTADAMLPPPTGKAMSRTTEMVVCIGASTGGTEALRTVLEALPANAPGIVIVQHMPEKFTKAFARRLNTLCQVSVKEAENGDTVMRGHVLIAPGGRHTLLDRQGARYVVSVREGPLVSRHRPSVDVLFRSAARSAGSNAVGVIMTGMGDDGARGLLEMKEAGARTIAQDEATSVVFGMPKEAIARGAAERIVPLGSIARELVRATVR